MTEQSIQAGVSCILMDKKDNVATLLREVNKGELLTISIEGVQSTIIAEENIKFGHKIAIFTISKGTHILKYGEVIGAATTNINIGQHVHVHNIEGIRGRGDKILKIGVN